MFFESISKWLSFKGRINQKDFWLYYALPFVLLNALPISFSSLFSIWVLLAGTVKRFHDSNVTGKVLIPFGILWAVVFVLSAAATLFSFLGAMSGEISKNEFFDLVKVFSLPILAFLLLPLYAGLKPSSPDENEYGPPSTPSPSQTQTAPSRKNKKIFSKGILLGIVVSFSVIAGFVAVKWINHLNEQETSKPALIYAIKDGKNVTEMRVLLENGEDPDQRTGFGTTALMLALDQL